MSILDAATHRPSDGGPSFGLGHRAYRAVWTLAWGVLASWTPPFFNPWRRVLLRLFGAKIAGTARIHASARIWYPANLEMEDQSCLGPRVECYTMAKITLGPYALASQGAHLCAGTHDYRKAALPLLKAPIAIGQGAWVCADAFVGPGVHIGEYAIVAARAVVSKAVEPWTIVAGNPARAIAARPPIEPA